MLKREPEQYCVEVDETRTVRYYVTAKSPEAAERMVTRSKEPDKDFGFKTLDDSWDVIDVFRTADRKPWEGK